MRLFKNMYAHAGAIVAMASLANTGVAKAALTNNSGFNVGGNADFSNGNTDVKSSVIKIANNVLNVILLISAILAVFYLIWSGIQYITSNGSPDRAKVARAGIINAIIGIVVIIAAYFIIRFAVGLGNTVSGADGSADGSGPQ